MVERYIKTVEEHLRKVVAPHQRDWEERLPHFLPAVDTYLGYVANNCRFWIR
jgi:hypothetical protein